MEKFFYQNFQFIFVFVFLFEFIFAYVVNIRFACDGEIYLLTYLFISNKYPTSIQLSYYNYITIWMFVVALIIRNYTIIKVV